MDSDWRDHFANSVIDTASSGACATKFPMIEMKIDLGKLIDQELIK